MTARGQVLRLAIIVLSTTLPVIAPACGSNPCDRALHVLTDCVAQMENCDACQWANDATQCIWLQRQEWDVFCSQDEFHEAYWGCVCSAENEAQAEAYLVATHSPQDCCH